MIWKMEMFANLITLMDPSLDLREQVWKVLVKTLKTLLIFLSRRNYKFCWFPEMKFKRGPSSTKIGSILTQSYYGIDAILPGYIRVLPEEEQDLLCVDEEGPAGEAAEKQHEHTFLQDDSHMLQVSASIGLGAHSQNELSALTWHSHSSHSRTWVILPKDTLPQILPCSLGTHDPHICLLISQQKEHLKNMDPWS